MDILLFNICPLILISPRRCGLSICGPALNPARGRVAPYDRVRRTVSPDSKLATHRLIADLLRRPVPEQLTQILHADLAS
eukprot:487579-Pleurochrysis_carterae.AAC.1